jgi:hypothetical protein
MAPVRVLLLTRVAGDRHESIPAAAAALTALPGLSVAVTDDPSLAGLGPGTDVVAFLSTTGDVLDAAARDAVRAFADARPGNHLLLTVDGATYAPGVHAMPAPHRVAWWRAVGDGRSRYTAPDHDAAAWADPSFPGHVAGGPRRAAG